MKSDLHVPEVLDVNILAFFNVVASRQISPHSDAKIHIISDNANWKSVKFIKILIFNGFGFSYL